MKLVHPELERQIEWTEHKECEWIIESPVLFATYLQELCKQNNGDEGKFVFSHNEVCLDFVKDVEIIVNPLEINLNDKKIISKIYNELRDLAYETDTYLKTQEIISNLRKYFFELEFQNSICLDIEEDVDLQLIFKALGVKVGENGQGFYENLVTYIKILSAVLKKKALILVNARSYFTDMQINELIDSATYDEINILFIENTQRTCIMRLKQYIIDDIGCEI